MQSLHGVFLLLGAKLGQYWGDKNKKPLTTRVKGYIVETAGFEPASRGPDTNLSTCVVYQGISHNVR